MKAHRRDVLKTLGAVALPFSGDVLEQLQDGCCVNSLGNVYHGREAPQAAVDDVIRNANGHGAVFLGNSVSGLSGEGYAPLTIRHEKMLRMTITGMGAATVLDGGDCSHGLILDDPTNRQSGLGRLRIADLRCETAPNSDYDGVHVTGVSEVWLTRVETQSVGRHGMYLAPRNGIYLNECLTEGSHGHSLAFRDLPESVTKIFRVRGGSFRAPKTGTNFHFANPHGNDIARVLIDGVNVVSQGDTPWLVDETNGNIYRSLVSNIVGTGGGVDIHKDSRLKLGLET